MYIMQFAPNIAQTARVLNLFVRFEWRCDVGYFSRCHQVKGRSLLLSVEIGSNYFSNDNAPLSFVTCQYQRRTCIYQYRYNIITKIYGKFPYVIVRFRFSLPLLCNPYFVLFFDNVNIVFVLVTKIALQSTMQTVSGIFFRNVYNC